MVRLLPWICLATGLAGNAGAQIAFTGAAVNGVTSTASITHVAAGASATRDNCGNITPGVPAGQVNDVLVALVLAREDSATVTMAGWTLLWSNTPAGEDHNAYIYYRVATSAAANGDPRTVSQSGTCNSIAAQISRFRNVDTTQPFETNPLPAGNWVYQDANSSTTGTQTTLAPNAMSLIATFVSDNRASAVPAGFTESYNTQLNVSRDLAISLKYRLETTAGAKGPFTMALGGGSTDDTHGVIFALRPSGLRVNVPPVNAGDVMIASIAVTPSTGVITAPTGWMLVRDTPTQGSGATERMATYYRVATAGEPASYAWTISGSAATALAGGISAFSGVDTISASPVNVHGGNTTASSLTHTATGVTTTVPNTMVLSVHSFLSVPNGWTVPALMQQAFDAVSDPRPTAAGMAVTMNYVIQAAAGATGDKSAVADGTGAATAAPGIAHILALRPAYAHYGISYTASDVATCEPAVVRIEAHHGAHGLAAPAAGTILTLNTSSGTGVWLSPVVTGTGVWAPSGANNGVATYTWPGDEYEVRVQLRHNTVASLNMNLSDNRTPSRTEAGTEDPTLNFHNSVWRVTANGSAAAAINTQIAGKRSDVGFNSQTLFVQAVATSPATGACTTLYQNQQVSVDFAAQCNNPATCSGVAGTDFEVLNRLGAFIAVAKNNGPAAPASYTAVSLQFSNDANAMAPLVVRYGDAGQMTLHVRSSLPAPPTTTISGSSTFVVRPLGLRVAVSGGPDAGNTVPTDSPTHVAGQNFTATVTGVKWVETADDANGDGVPDSDAEIAANAATPNFGLETSPITPSLTPILLAPIPGTLGSITSGTWSAFAGGSSSATVSYSEVGLINLQGSTSSYLGTGAVTNSAAGLLGVGRFIPASFRVEGGATITNRYLAGCGTTWTYMDEAARLNFTLSAQNAAGNLTANYRDTYAKLGLTTANLGLGAKSGTTNLTSRIDAGALLGTPSWTGGQAVLQVPAAIRRGTAPTNDNPDGPYTAIQWGIAPTDGEVAMNTLDLDVDTSGTPERKSLGVSGEVRYGRLRCQNANGPAGIQVPIPVNAQYFTSGAFTNNGDDSCSQVTATSIVNRLGTVSLASTLPLTISGGAGNVRFTGSTPQAAADVTITAPAYLRGDWLPADADSNANTRYDDNPVCSVGFGVFGAQPRQFIYQRENY